MTTVAGVKFVDLWAWSCPTCKKRLVRTDERLLESEAREHFAAKHGTPDHPLLPFADA